MRSYSRFVAFNIIFGLSMACPLIAGLVALMKDAHPDWNPTSSIKFAMMVTTLRIDNMGGKMVDAATIAEAIPFGNGAGQVQSDKALDPDLI